MVTIGIDPDCEKSGCAIIDGKHVEAYSLRFAPLLDKVREMYVLNRGNVRVFVEAGWLNSSHWHLDRKMSLAVAATIGNGVGRNHETGRKIIEYLLYHGISVTPVHPLRKFWCGTDRKITAEELNRQLSLRGMNTLGRTSQDARDSVLIALAYM